MPPGFVVTAGALDQPQGVLDNALIDAVTRLGPGPFAVRSSGAAEDLPDASYAGLYETLPDAVRRCFASATGDRVAAYQRRRDDILDAAEHGGPAAVAVLVQPMVTGTAAGVAFAAHPVTGARDETVVTAVAGLGSNWSPGRLSARNGPSAPSTSNAPGTPAGNPSSTPARPAQWPCSPGGSPTAI